MNTTRYLPSVSVIIPTKGRLEELKNAIDSVFIQSHRKWELIIVVDSEDNEEYKKICSILLEFNAKLSQNSQLESKFLFDGRDILVVRKADQSEFGPAFARNLGVSKSKFDYLAFLDSDDVWLEKKLELQINYMLNFNLWASHTDYFIVTKGTQEKNFVSTAIMQGDRLAKRIAFRDCLIATPTVIINQKNYRSIINQEIARELFPSKITKGEDLVAWLQIASVNPRKFGHLANPLTIVNVNNESARMNPMPKSSKTLLAETAHTLGVKRPRIPLRGDLRLLILSAMPPKLKILLKKIVGDV